MATALAVEQDQAAEQPVRAVLVLAAWILACRWLTVTSIRSFGVQSKASQTARHAEPVYDETAVSGTHT